MQETLQDIGLVLTAINSVLFVILYIRGEL